MSALARMWVHTVTVTPYLGKSKTDGSDQFGSPSTVTGWLEDGTKLVRTADGSELTSAGATFYTDPGNAALFPPDAQVQLTARTARVIAVNVNDSGPLGLPDHCVVALT